MLHRAWSTIDIIQLKNKALILIVFLCFSIFINPVRSDQLETSITIMPDSQIIGAGKTFQIGVYCIPSEPMKSFEINIDFNAALLQANQVSKGSIFNGYLTFFNSGTIDNNNGRITSIYDLIMGPGNVNTPGFLINVSF